MAAHKCAFCGADQSEVALLFRSALGGEPPFICDACVRGFNQIAEVDRQSPALADVLVATHNAAIGRGRRKP